MLSYSLINVLGAEGYMGRHKYNTCPFFMYLNSES